MKTYLVCLLVLSVFAADFETFQEALNFDAQSLECGNDDFFTSQYEAFFPWIQLIEEGEIEMQEDHSVLTQARDKIKEVREYIMSLDEEIEQERGSQQQAVEQQTVAQEPEQPAPTGPAEQQPQPQPEPVSESESEDEDDDPFGWGAGEIPQMLVHKKKTHNGHAKVLLEVMNGSKTLKFKSKIRKIIAMATSLDTDMGTQDVVERKNRKIELCDLILDELVNMIDFLEKVQDDIDFQVEALDIFRKQQEEIVKVANGCGARVVSLQDTSSVSFVETQPLKKNKKQDKKNKKRRN